MRVLSNMLGNDTKINSKEIAIKRGNALHTLDETELWEKVYSSSGSSTNITLSKSCATAKKAKVYAKNDDGHFLGAVEIENPNNSVISIIDFNQSGASVWTKTAKIKFQNNNVSFVVNSLGTLTRNSVNIQNTACIYITRIDLLF